MPNKITNKEKWDLVPLSKAKELAEDFYKDVIDGAAFSGILLYPKWNTDVEMAINFMPLILAAKLAPNELFILSNFSTL